MEHNEDFLTTAVREVKEETNLDVEIQSIINVSSNFLAPHHHTLVITVSANIIGGEAKAGDDLVELAWFLMKGVLPEMAFNADIHILHHYEESKIHSIPVHP